MTDALVIYLPAAGEIALRNAGNGALTLAQSDEQAVMSWLAKYRDSPRTLDAYSREAERMLLWLSDRGAGLRSMTVEHVLAYKSFLRNPSPPERWLQQPIPELLPDGTRNPAWHPIKRLPRSDPGWRPFVAPLSDSAANQAATILHGLCEYLAAIGYLSGNPFRAAARRRPRGKRRVERFLDQQTWQSVLAAIECMPRETPRDRAHYARARFALRLLYLTGLRREELCRARTSDLLELRGKLWLKVRGKGGVEDEVPLTGEAVQEIRAYRVSLGKPPWPSYGEVAPLLLDIHGKRSVSVKALHALVKDAFSFAASLSQDDRQRDTLQRASCHWLRHTAATHQIEQGVPARIVQRNLRHSSAATTALYVHAEHDDQHAQTSGKHRLMAGV